MFGSLGVPELLLIFFVILVVFGPRRIPEIGRTLGKALGEFKKATDDLKNTIEREVRLEELKQAVPSMVTPFESISRSEPVPAIAPVAAIAAPPVDPAVQATVEPAAEPIPAAVETPPLEDPETSA
jgi:TatA/E family protein of Tat protein translocase